MKKMMAIALAILLLAGIAPAARSEATPPISSGTVNKTTQIHWGKGVQFPVLATVYAGTKLDVYEYDADWVLVLYKTYGSYLGEFKELSFYGYMSREDIDCDPPLEGEKSDKADTGPGKKKGKRPKPKPGEQPAEPSPGPTQGPDSTEEPEVSVEPMEEFDWIIHTNGLQTQKVTVTGLTVSCSFSLMAQKAGGSAPSSDPAFNQGMRVPYAATAFYSMKLSMSSALDEMGVSGFMSGEGGFDVSMQTSGATFYIDTGAEDFSLVSFTLPMQATGTLDPSITGDTGSGTIKAQTGTTSLSGESSLSVQLKKSGGGYKFVLVGLKPGGGNLEFPAVLEKTFADPDRFDKEAAKADARRKKAEEEQARRQEEMKREAEEAAKSQPEETPELAPLTPVTPDPLAPLVPEETPELAPLTPVTPEPLAPLVPEEEVPPLAPLTPVDDDEAPPFPEPSGHSQRRDQLCA